MEIIPVTGALGAEIRGVDLRHIDDDVAAVKHALLEHEVVFFRQVHLTEEEQLDLGSEGKTPEEIEEQNRGLVAFTDCLKGRGWNPPPMEPDENGLLQVAPMSPGRRRHPPTPSSTWR